MDRLAGAEAGADDAPGLSWLGRQKNANEIITLRDRKDVPYAGLDVHRNTIQVAVLDGNGKILANGNIPHTPEAVREMAGRLPEHTKYTAGQKFVIVYYPVLYGTALKHQKSSIIMSMRQVHGNSALLTLEHAGTIDFTRFQLHQLPDSSTNGW